ncbi:MAG: N-6 DNA methylase, partial [Gemmatimonadota bacterium]|nr:N-6 DNA methylase [Gemmatimonadota bacterium]
NLLDVPTLQDCMDRSDDTFLRALIDAWKAILKIDYCPVFDPAVSVLETFRAVDHNVRMGAVHAVRLLVKYALAHADDLAALRFDHAGPLYHRLLESARYDGSFYTNNVSALLLARLALTENFTDWSDEEGLGKLKVIDPACGTGTLLMAAMHTIRDRYINAAGQDADFLHLFMVEEMLHGLDINRHGIQLAACNLTLGNPRVDYTKMNLYTMRHGPQADGKTHIGSLELLATAEDDGTPNLRQFILPLPRLENLEAERAQPGDVNGDSYVGIFDVVIMNPPFTRNDIRNRQYTESNRKRIQDREKEAVNFLRKRQGSLGVTSAGEAINHTSIETFFTPLADILLKSTDAVFAQVIPTTALTGSSAKVKRIFLAERFQIETIITSHDPSRVNFSENTDIHESLFIARRSDAENKPTRFISLGRMPRDAHEAMLLSDMINQGKISTEWGREHEWRWERMRDGDWQAALFYDGELAEAYYDLAALNGTRLQIADNTCKIEPAGRRVRDAFSRNPKLAKPWKTPVLWEHQTDVHTTMAAKPDVIATPKRGREKYAQSLVKKASRLAISERLYTYAVRTAACYTEEPVLGSAWMPVTSLSTTPYFDQALCAWWNSTPGILTMLHARSKKLTYPAYSLDLLRKLLIPNPRNVDVSPLIDVFAKTHQQVLKPWKEMDTCPVRALIDEAAAQVLHMDGAKIADWRKRITLEPTVSNRPAVAHFG